MLLIVAFFLAVHTRDDNQVGMNILDKVGILILSFSGIYSTNNTSMIQTISFIIGG